MGQRFNTIDDYMAFFSRRKYRILIPLAIVAGIAALVAFLLPSIYKSTSTIVIETQQIPQELIRTTVTGYVEERLKIISQEIMGRTNLVDIVERFGLYRDMKDKKTTEEIMEKMRENIILETVAAETMDRKTGRATPVTVAFTLSFEGEYPTQVQNVANALASLYLEGNLRARTGMAETTAQFLEKEAEIYRQQCAEFGQKIAVFKEQHLTELPELLQLNLQAEQQMRTQMDNLDRDIRSLQERKISLEGSLSSVRPESSMINETGQRIPDSRESLKMARSRLVSLQATLSGKHPDVVKTKKEVERLEQELQLKDDIQRKRKELEGKKADLQKLLGGATEKHPDVIRLKNEIAQYEVDIDRAGQKQATLSGSAREEADNPVYINLKTQLTSTGQDLASMKKQRGDLHKRWTDYLRRLDNTPLVESGYSQLNRDYDNARNKYQETMNKLMEARQGLSLEQTQAGERFTIVEPAQFPEKPEKPNRLAIVLIGLILGLGAGIGYASILEFSDTSVRTAEELEEITGLPVLAVIPRILTVDEVSGRKKFKWYYWAAALAVIIIAAIIFHFAVMDLELFWIKLMRKL
ncbi:MAG: GNVR domain-containing protein [Pseudomonadota bacterium]